MKNLSKAVIVLTALASADGENPSQICCACTKYGVKDGPGIEKILTELLGENNALTVIRLAALDADRGFTDCGVYLDKVLEVICILLKSSLREKKRSLAQHIE